MCVCVLVCACVCVRVEGIEKSTDVFAEYVWGLVVGECHVHMLTKHFKGQRRLLIDWSSWGSPGESTLVVFRTLAVCLLSCNCFFQILNAGLSRVAPCCCHSCVWRKSRCVQTFCLRKLMGMNYGKSVSPKIQLINERATSARPRCATSAPA